MTFLTSFNSTLKAKYKTENPMMVNEMKKVDVESFSSGSVTLDLVSGIGGLVPRGHIVEVVGANTSGKTTICIQTCVDAQRKGINSMYIDVEGVFDVTYARALGLDTDAPTFTLLQPDVGEEVEGIIDELDLALAAAKKAKKGKPLTEPETVGLIIIDSVASARPRLELQGNKQIGQHASLWSRISYKLKNVAKNHNIGFALINQVRFAPSIGGGFSAPGVLDSAQANEGSENTTGGEALKYVYSIRWQFKGFAKIEREVKDKLSGETATTRVGNISNVVAIKNKLSPPLVKTKFAIEFGKGTVDYHVTEELLKKQGVISNKGSYVKYDVIDQSLLPDNVKNHETYPGYFYGRARFNEWFRSDAVQADANKRIIAFFNQEEIETIEVGDGTLDDTKVASDALSFEIEDMKTDEDGTKVTTLGKGETLSGKADKPDPEKTGTKSKSMEADIEEI